MDPVLNEISIFPFFIIRRLVGLLYPGSVFKAAFDLFFIRRSAQKARLHNFTLHVSPRVSCLSVTIMVDENRRGEINNLTGENLSRRKVQHVERERLKLLDGWSPHKNTDPTAHLTFAIKSSLGEQINKF